jgi:Spy/CpxP family protein refolding chaperone
MAMSLTAAALTGVTGCGITDEGLSSLTDLLSQLASDYSSRNAQGQLVDRPGGLGLRLNLTAEQKELAKPIFESQHADIKALHEQARTDIRNLLTADQQAIFDELPPPPHSPHGPGHGPPPQGGAFGQQDKPMGPPPGMQHEPFDPAEARQRRLDHLTEVLSLTPDQVAQITVILDNLDAAIQARREQGKAEFRAILTPEQIAILDEIEANHP